MQKDRVSAIQDFLGAAANGIAAPFTRWHQDELTAMLYSEQMEYAHRERMEAMRLVGVAMEKGMLDSSSQAFLAGYCVGAAQGGSSQHYLPGS